MGRPRLIRVCDIGKSRGFTPPQVRNAQPLSPARPAVSRPVSLCKRTWCQPGIRFQLLTKRRRRQGSEG
ncbi:hypothetical protein ElyMa_006342900 [Elysia marginata]|uniref:Uncharacterized protein n=1 Tax=Elysia marginata TaxID=1093978 RepID=A0AAV4HNK2_9GAST|nr:hypothetical protein ElyMa_006342900 [Elysia marginata]